MTADVSSLAPQLIGALSNAAAAAVDRANRAPDPPDDPALYDAAFLAAAARAGEALSHATAEGRIAPPGAVVAWHVLLQGAGRHGAGPAVPGEVQEALAEALPRAVDEVVSARGAGMPHGLDTDHRIVADTFRRFAEEVVRPHAESIHREDRDIPEEIIEGLGQLGAFGMSIPAAYGGFQEDGDLRAMVIATEELSRVSLGAAGSLITRPEILARALLQGGTETQKQRWLPDIASGRSMVAVAVTEPDAGSDVAALSLSAAPDGDMFRLNGTKIWCTFAGRAELLMVLARTEEDPALGHRGLSLFVIEKPRRPGHEFEVTQEAGGVLRGRAIPTIGYRGMHSFELEFVDWLAPAMALVGGGGWRGRGFHLQMDAFATGRLQTAARAVGLMEAATDAAFDHAAARHVFGRPLIVLPLTRLRLAEMVAKTELNRWFCHHVAGAMVEDQSGVGAAMVKALACRAAEEVARDAMQIHGGYGYAEEYAVSRYFVDARVLSIFEGAEEVLALRVIGRRLLTEA